MTAIAFDTLKYANRLKAAGVPDKQAEVMAEAQADVFDKNLEDLATKRDLKDLENATRREIKDLELRMAAELAPLKRGMAVCVAGVIALILKAFFPH